LYATTKGKISLPKQAVAAGHLYTVNSEGSGNWQQRITFDVPFAGDPHAYVVMVTQDDYGNNDGRNEYPPHVEKLDEGITKTTDIPVDSVDLFFILETVQNADLCGALLRLIKHQNIQTPTDFS